jgi:hypothetical protein
MAIRIRNAALLLLLFAGLLSNPPDLSSCGPFLPTAAFDAARRESLPQATRREIAMAGWVRSILLG